MEDTVYIKAEEFDDVVVSPEAEASALAFIKGGSEVLLEAEKFASLSTDIQGRILTSLYNVYRYAFTMGQKV